VKLIRSALERFTAEELSKILGKSKSTIYRYAKGEVIPSEEVVAKVLALLPIDVAFASVGKEVLKAYGLLDREGKPKLTPLLAILSVTLGDPLLRKLILEWISRALGNEVLELKPEPALILKWSEEFERYLKDTKGISEEQVAYYRSLFERYFEGKVLNEEFVEEVANLSDWARVTFRHYIRWLQLEREIDNEFAEWVLKKVPTRRYKVSVKIHEISFEDVRKALKVLSEKDLKLYWLYRLLLESGIRLAHALELIENWNPNEKVFVDALGRIEERCKCFEEHCRCWLGIKRGRKSALWSFMSKETFEKLNELAPIKLSRTWVSKKAKELGILEPSKLRKFSEQYMKEAFAKKSVELGEHPEVLMQFVQGRTGELKVSHLYYDNLLRKADLVYPTWLELVKNILS
jgi:intergrase/recombinase